MDTIELILAVFTARDWSYSTSPEWWRFAIEGPIEIFIAIIENTNRSQILTAAE